MKAAVLEKYDKKGRELVIREVPTPEPARGEVLVRVLTAGGSRGKTVLRIA